jgi:hypothetical protein
VVRERAYVVAEDRVARDAGLVLAHVRERRAAIDVADRVEPAAVDADGTEAVVDLHRPTRLETDRLQPEVGRGRPAPDADQQLVAREFAVVLEPERDRSVRAGGGCRTTLEQDLDPLRFERLFQLLARERLLAAEEARAALHDRDLAPEAAESLRELDAGRAAAEHEEPRRDARGLGGLPIRPRHRVGESFDGRNERRGAGGDDDRAARLEPCRRAVPRHVDHALAREPAVAAVERRADPLQPLHLTLVRPARGHVVALGEGRARVDPAVDGLDRAGNAPRRREHVARPNERLRGDAAPVRAFAAHELALDERDRETAARAALDGDLARWTAADHDDVEFGHGS